MVPCNWPSDLRYTNIVNQKRNLEIQQLKGVQILKIEDEDHPLNGEYGLFPTRQWLPFEIIGTYTGEVVKNTPGRYVARLFISKNGNNWCVDAEKEGNETRFINDYRNIAPEPNVFFSKTVVNGKITILVVVIKPINIGDEIVSDYGEDYWDFFKNN